ncbi:MAG: copper homeostasis protein CutC [Defluviitaleaceae bacterium]|nr:copper homeostasis protein CutC [Defluviitaleaceae bacterium]
MKNKTVIEICCGSAADVFAAKEGGADRVELCSALFLGGLTPSIGQVQVSKNAGIEIMAMLRPRQGGFCYSDLEFETILMDARAILDAGADGLVFGILSPDGTVDAERCERLIKIADKKPCMFHRAIDVVPDWKAALETVCDLGFTRILTSGRAPKATDGVDVIREMKTRARGRVEILPGGGVTLANAREIIELTGCDQIHASMSAKRRDNSAAANPAIQFCGAEPPASDVYSASDAEAIRELSRSIADE